MSEALSTTSLEDPVLEALSRSVSDVSIGPEEFEDDPELQQARAGSVYGGSVYGGSVYDGSEHGGELQPLSRSVSAAPLDGEYRDNYQDNYQDNSALQRARGTSVAGSRYSYGDYDEHIQVTRDNPPQDTTPERTPRAAIPRGSYLGLPGKHATTMARSASGSSRHSDRTVKAGGESANVSTIGPLQSQTDYVSQRRAFGHMGLSSATPTPLPSVVDWPATSTAWPGTPREVDNPHGYPFAESDNPNLLSWIMQQQSYAGSASGGLSPERTVASPPRLDETDPDRAAATLSQLSPRAAPRMIRGLSTVVPAGRELATDQRSPRFETRTITGASHSTLLPLASENNQFTGSRVAPVAHADPAVEFQLLHGMLVERRHITFMDSPADFEQRQRALQAWKDGDTSAATMTVLNDLRIEYGRVTGTFQWDPEEVFIEDPK